jgi:Family of unknown function (DUF6464)
MEQLFLPTEVLTAHPEKSLGKLYLDWIPQPGNYLEIEGKAYKVLERSHRYQLKLGQYRLCSMVIQVQITSIPTETSLVDGTWVIGDARCKYNAHSELIRCAVNPLGTCNNCQFWEMDVVSID